MLLLAAVLTVGLTGMPPAPVTAALWTEPRPATQQVEFRRTVSRCMTTLAELTGLDGELRDGQRAQPTLWTGIHSGAPAPILILTADPFDGLGLPHPVARLGRHVLNLPPPLA